jgi:predicted N-acetyltransferase YhbS
MMIRMKIQGADRKNIQQAIDLSSNVFGSGFLKDNYMREEDFNPSNIRLLYDKDTLASTACVLPRKMYFDGLELKLAGIGGVATSPEFRGRGFAGALMKDTIKYMEEQGCALSMLYPYKASYYEKLGYRQVLFPFKVIDIKNAPASQAGYRIKQALIPSCGGTKQVYDSFCRDKTGPVKRTASYWRLNCRYWPGQAQEYGWQKEPFFAAYSGNKLAAYAKVSTIRKDWGKRKYSLKISELAYLRGEEAAVDALIHEACLFASRSGFKKIFYDDACGLNLKYGREPTKTEITEYDNFKNMKMYRICDFRALMKKLSILFSRRLKKAGIKPSWRCHINVKRSVREYNGTIILELKNKGYKIILDEGAFIKMILGLQTPVNIRILKVLFPRLKPVFWDFDYL